MSNAQNILISCEPPYISIPCASLVSWFKMITSRRVCQNYVKMLFDTFFILILWTLIPMSVPAC